VPRLVDGKPARLVCRGFPKRFTGSIIKHLDCRVFDWRSAVRLIRDSSLNPPYTERTTILRIRISVTRPSPVSLREIGMREEKRQKQTHQIYYCKAPRGAASVSHAYEPTEVCSKGFTKDDSRESAVWGIDHRLGLHLGGLLDALGLVTAPSRKRALVRLSRTKNRNGRSKLM
jgi:hypothetical protein